MVVAAEPGEVQRIDARQLGLDHQLIVLDKDLVQERTPHIRAERRQKTKEETPGHSEFRYGSFARRLPLPNGASEEQVTASYQDGILEVRVPLPPEKPAETAKRIQVRRT